VHDFSIAVWSRTTQTSAPASGITARTRGWRGPRRRQRLGLCLGRWQICFRTGIGWVTIFQPARSINGAGNHGRRPGNRRRGYSTSIVTAIGKQPAPAARTRSTLPRVAVWSGCLGNGFFNGSLDGRQDFQPHLSSTRSRPTQAALFSFHSRHNLTPQQGNAQVEIVLGEEHQPPPATILTCAVSADLACHQRHPPTYPETKRPQQRHFL